MYIYWRARLTRTLIQGQGQLGSSLSFLSGYCMTFQLFTKVTVYTIAPSELSQLHCNQLVLVRNHFSCDKGQQRAAVHPLQSTRLRMISLSPIILTMQGRRGPPDPLIPPGPSSGESVNQGSHSQAVTPPSGPLN